MHYYTQFTLNVRNLKNKEQFDKLVEELKTRDLLRYAFDDGEYNKANREAIFYPYEEVTWTDHAKDMVLISENYPNAYFELEGDGEDSDDFWREYYHDGEREFCRGEVVYEQPRKVLWDKLLVNF